MLPKIQQLRSLQEMCIHLLNTLTSRRCSFEWWLGQFNVNQILHLVLVSTMLTSGIARGGLWGLKPPPHCSDTQQQVCLLDIAKLQPEPPPCYSTTLACVTRRLWKSVINCSYHEICLKVSIQCHQLQLQNAFSLNSELKLSRQQGGVVRNRVRFAHVHYSPPPLSIQIPGYATANCTLPVN